MSASSMQETASHPSSGQISQTAQTGSAKIVLSRLAHRFPPLVALAALGGLLLWGHQMGWTVPRLSLIASDAKEPKDDWCAAHGVPETQCVECNPELLPRPKSYGWCRIHGVHECPLEHPDVAQLLTRPRLAAADLAQANRALEFAERPENNRKCILHERRIQFISQDAVQKAGIEVEPVWTGAVVESLACNGEITYDQTRTARLSSRVPGTIFRVMKQAGDPVRQGDALALVDAAEVGKAKSEFLHALLQVRIVSERLQRVKEAYDRGAIPPQSYQEQASALSEARVRLVTAREAMTNLGLPVAIEDLQNTPGEKLADCLRFLGLPESVTGSLNPLNTTGNLLAVTAPFDGIVTGRQIVGGEVVDSSKLLFTVVDVRRMWATLDLRVEDAKRVSLGNEFRFRPDGGKESESKIDWISTEADPKTRTLKIRASLDNGQGRLRASTFGSGRVILRRENQAVVVPNSAVHWEGCCHVVFVRDKHFLDKGAPKVFHVRTVRVGARDENQTEIIAGVLPGEIVAGKGSGLLRSELLKNNLGEG